VQSGDTLSAIADETGVSVENLLQFNPGVDANSMRVGQKLKLTE
jgi:LysM repeat protein